MRFRGTFGERRHLPDQRPPEPTEPLNRLVELTYGAQPPRTSLQSVSR